MEFGVVAEIATEEGSLRLYNGLEDCLKLKKDYGTFSIMDFGLRKCLFGCGSVVRAQVLDFYLMRSRITFTISLRPCNRSSFVSPR
jgi:hypothetical protein